MRFPPVAVHADRHVARPEASKMRGIVARGKCGVKQKAYKI